MKYNEKLVIKLYNNLKSADEISKILKYSKPTIYRILERNNIKRRNSSDSRHKNSKYVMPDGYVHLVPRIEEKHLNPNKTVIMAEHRLVMARHLKRPLTKQEFVHHKNGDRADNRLENLELWSKSQPPGQRIADKIRWAKDFLKFYDYKVIKIKGKKYE